jgi:hypothetical protein
MASIRKTQHLRRGEAKKTHICFSSGKRSDSGKKYVRLPKLFTSKKDPEEEYYSNYVRKTNRPPRTDRGKEFYRLYYQPRDAFYVVSYFATSFVATIMEYFGIGQVL